jgi:transposase
VDHCRCGSGVHWCARADALFDVAGLHVLEVTRDPDRFVMTVETDADATGCGRCGVVAVGHGRRLHRAADAPCFGVPVVLRWLKRIWRCAEPDCPTGTWSETHDLIGPRAVVTSQAIGWAVDALAHDDTTVSALARHLGVDWHTLWAAVKRRRLDAPADPSAAAGCARSAWTSTSGGLLNDELDDDVAVV